MIIKVFSTRVQAAEQCALRAGAIITESLAARGEANVVAATGISQFEVLESLAVYPGLDWSRVTFFHLDEYVGIPASHPGSFRRYLKERIQDRVHPRHFHFIDGGAPDPYAECGRLARLIRPLTIDLLFAGVGQNGHLAFNEPPADFDVDDPFIVVDLAPVSREQQFEEGWFASIDDVPTRAISMSVKQIMRARHVLCVAPGVRKAEMVRDCLELPVSPLRPASVLRNHLCSVLYLDPDAASLLSERLEVEEC